MSKIAVVLIFMATSLILGCDEQSTNPMDVSASLSDQPAVNGQGINGGLTGRLITTYRYQPYEFNLVTGAATALPLVTSLDFYNAQPDVGNASRWNFFAAGDSSPNQGYVETLYNCLTLPTGSCLSVYDDNYRVVRRVRVADRVLREPAKLSPSSRYVVMSHLSGYELQTSSILLMDVDAARVTEAIDLDNYATGRDNLIKQPVVEWGHDDEIYYSVSADQTPTVYVTSPGTLNTARTIKLPVSYSGYINSIDIHPDGGQLLLEYRSANDGPASIAVILDLTTLGLRFPAVNEADLNRQPMGDDFTSTFKNPTWSPDGRYIMFLNTWTTGSVNPVLVPGIDPPQDYMVAVPSESGRVIVNSFLDDYPPPLPAIAIQIQHPDRGDIVRDWPASSTINSGHVEWID